MKSYSALLLPVMLVLGFAVGFLPPAALPHELGHVIGGWITGHRVQLLGWQETGFGLRAGEGKIGPFPTVMGPLIGSLFWGALACRLVAKRRSLHLVVLLVGVQLQEVFLDALGAGTSGLDYTSVGSETYIPCALAQVALLWATVGWVVVRSRTYARLEGRLPRIRKSVSAFGDRMANLEEELRKGRYG
jgi:hypothetical protein